jgi:hypothetical protein
VAVWLCVGVAACAQKPAALGPEEPTLDRPAPADVEAAATAFDDAEASLQRVMVSSGDQAVEGQRQTVTPDDSTAETPLADREKEEGRSRATLCSRACRALASMERSANRLCELTSEEDERCEGARRRLGSAQELVRRSCPACGD